MLEIPTTPDHYIATLEGRRRHALVAHTSFPPVVNEMVWVCEVEGGSPTGRRCGARVTHVETIHGVIGPIHVLSVEVRMSVDRMPATLPAPFTPPEE